MPRPIPAPPGAALRVYPTEELFALAMHVVTPLFGGADEAGTVDVNRNLFFLAIFNQILLNA